MQQQEDNPVIRTAKNLLARSHHPLQRVFKLFLDLPRVYESTFKLHKDDARDRQAVEYYAVACLFVGKYFFPLHYDTFCYSPQAKATVFFRAASANRVVWQAAISRCKVDQCGRSVGQFEYSPILMLFSFRSRSALINSSWSIPSCVDTGIRLTMHPPSPLPFV